MSDAAKSKTYEEDLTVVDEARVRHYHSGSSIPYRGMLHDLYTDEKLDWISAVHDRLATLPEGATIAIEIHWRAPKRKPTDVYMLTEPHKYGVSK